MHKILLTFRYKGTGLTGSSGEAVTHIIYIAPTLTEFFPPLFTAGLFILPGKLWKIMEGGMIESFGTEGKAMILLSEDARYDEAITMEAVVEKYVKVMGQKIISRI